MKKNLFRLAVTRLLVDHGLEDVQGVRIGQFAAQIDGGGCRIWSKSMTYCLYSQSQTCRALYDGLAELDDLRFQVCEGEIVEVVLVV